MALRKKHAVQGGDADRYVKVEKKKGTLLKSFRTQKQIWFLCLLALIWVVIFCYIPMQEISWRFLIGILECHFHKVNLWDLKILNVSSSYQSGRWLFEIHL